MTNAKESYEAQILDKLIGNSERLAVIELTVTQTKAEIKVLNNKVEVLDNKVEVLDNKVEKLNSRLSKVEEVIEQIDSKQNIFFTILAGIGTGILATLYSQPILNAISKLN